MRITTILFDLGGVLIELGPLSSIMSTSPQDAETIWNNWVHCVSVKKFESGMTTEETFCHDMISEFELDLSPRAFLEAFKAWPVGPFTGAESLLKTLSRDFQIACLSNTNLTHYEHFLSEQPIMEQFDALFLSHLTGLLKPEPDAFEHVLATLGISPDEVLFFDDNPHNVSVARQLGISSQQVNAPNDITDTLSRLGLLA